MIEKRGSTFNPKLNVLKTRPYWAVGLGPLTLSTSLNYNADRPSKLLLVERENGPLWPTVELSVH